MKAFTEVVQHQGFAAAGRQMGLSRAVVNKLVLQLEADLDTQLLQRTTRRVSPTDAGRAYYERCLNILAEVDEAEQAIAQLQVAPKGTLRINAPMTFGTMHLAPAIAAFMAQYPDLRVELSLNDRFVDLIEEGYDVTVRIADIEKEDGLVTQAIASIPLVMCAAPQYLQKYGIPTTPADLTQHHCLSYGHFSSSSQWQLRSQNQSSTTVNVNCRFFSNNGEALRDAAIQGLGIVRLPEFIVKAALESNQLQKILEEFAPSALTAFIAYAPNRYLSHKIQLLVEFLQRWF